MDRIVQDIRYAFRSMRQTPGFTATAIITLAIGIAANVTVFTAVNAVLLKALPYAHPEQLIAVIETVPSQNFDMQVSYQNYRDWKAGIHAVQDIGVYVARDITIVTPEGGERISGAQVSPNMFPLLGVSPAMGRGFLEEEGPPAQASVAILSDGLWRRRFGGDPNILGTSIKVNGVMTTIVGIMPPRFRFPETADIWVPVEGRETRGTHYLNAIGRLSPGMSLRQAREEMDTLALRLDELYPIANNKLGVKVTPLNDSARGENGPLLWALLGAVFFVLLIAVANVANLLLSRSTVRQRELAIRAALGAGRGRIVRQLLTESLLLSLAGGTAGCLISLWAVDALVQMIPEELPFFVTFDVDARVAGFALVVTFMTGILFGLAPAIASARPNLNRTLKESSRQSSVGGRRLAHNALITTEVALALVLLIGSGLMIESFLFISRVRPGFDAGNVLVMEVSLVRAKYADTASRMPFHQRALAGLAALPGVEVASATSSLPLGGSSDTTGFTIEGRAVSEQGNVPICNEQFIAPGYFRAMHIPLMRGRDFSEADDGRTERTVIVDETLAKRYWPNEDPIGKRLKFGGPQSQTPWNTVVGVAGDVKHYGLKGRGPGQVTIYINYLQNNTPYFNYVLRTTSQPQAIAASAREVLKSIDAEQPLYNVRTMNEVVKSSYWQDGFFSELFGIFAAIALGLAAVGIYGIVSYAVNQRVQEIGIRMALGASGNDVLQLVVGQGLAPVAVGIGIGVVAAFIVMKLLKDIFYGVSPTDPMTFVSIPLVLLAVAVTASYLPARRATRVDPVIALRHQ